MDKATITKLGCGLYDAAKDRKAMLPAISHVYTDFSIDEAYEMQKVMIDCYLKDGYHLSGRKVGMTSDAMRKQFDINEPDYGYLFKELKYQNGDILYVDDFLEPMVEAELAFALKEDLSMENVTARDVLHSTEYIVAALEIIDARTQHFETTIADSISDNASFAAYVVGDEILMPYEKDLSLLGMIVEKNGKQVTSSSGASVMGNPAEAVAWLANKMNSLGDPLKAGELILAGSFVSAMPAKEGDYFAIKYGGLGEMNVSFRRR